MELGYPAVTMTTIADHAKVSRATLYRYYSTKEQIYSDNDTGRVLEKSFRKAVRESKIHGYVSFNDRAANNDISIMPDLVIQDRSGKTTIVECKSDRKKAPKKKA